MRQRLHGVYFKNLIITVMLLCISFIILGASFAALSYNFIIRQQRKTMREDAETAGKMVSACIEQWDSADGLEVKIILQWMEETTDFHVIVTDETGVVVSCSDEVGSCPHIGMSVPTGTIGVITGTGEYSGFSSFDGLYSENRYIVGIALPSTRWVTESRGYIFMSGDAENMSQIWRNFAAIYLIVALVVIMIAFTLTSFATKTQTKPIKEMADAAKRFGQGDFSARVTCTDREDEIGELAESFNTMADSLERSEKSRRELIGNVSHELKTPMTTITGFADGILDGTIPPEKHREYLEIISSETKRLSRLVRGMLDMSKVQDINSAEVVKKSFDLTEVICQSLLSLEKKITDKGLDVDTQLPEEPVIALGDQDAIIQVVYNLIDNAAKFGQPGTNIGLALWKEDGKAYVSVENHGETISKDELPLIFDRFHKTDRSRSMDKEGVGLGLYIVKTILDSHGEDIFVTSRDGVTKFVFTMTLAKS
jgi:signal transduction histidine kinase